ncbi:MAG: flavodoxin family protein [Candidatus Gastranaerophilaceae bacterium]
MPKSILLISASPREGANSDTLCNQFMTGAIKSGKEAEKVRICDMHINYCNACGKCHQDCDSYCPIDDDMPKLLDKMINSDVIVIATPVYFYTIPAQLKTVIDRSSSRFSEITNKEFYFIIVGSDSREWTLQRAYVELEGFITCLSGSKEKAVLYGTNLMKSTDIQNSPLLKRAYTLGYNA